MGFATITGNVQSLMVLNVALTPTSVNGSTTVEQTYTVRGLRSGDYVTVKTPTVTAGISAPLSRAAGTDLLGITWANSTGGALTPPIGNYQLFCLRYDATTAAFNP